MVKFYVITASLKRVINGVKGCVVLSHAWRGTLTGGMYRPRCVVLYSGPGGGGDDDDDDDDAMMISH